MALQLSAAPRLGAHVLCSSSCRCRHCSDRFKRCFERGFTYDSGKARPHWISCNYGIFPTGQMQTLSQINPFFLPAERVRDTCPLRSRDLRTNPVIKALRINRILLTRIKSRCLSYSRLSLPPLPLLHPTRSLGKTVALLAPRLRARARALAGPLTSRGLGLLLA